VKVFCDANILFSAADSGSFTSKLFKQALGSAELTTSLHAAEEARRNLAVKRPSHLNGLETLLAHLGMVHALADTTLEWDLDPQDTPIMLAAIAGTCTHLLTSDKKHFWKYYGTTVQGVRVVSSVMLAEIIQG
jgi:hypothetical protein